MAFWLVENIAVGKWAVDVKCDMGPINFEVKSETTINFEVEVSDNSDNPDLVIKARHRLYSLKNRTSAITTLYLECFWKRTALWFSSAHNSGLGDFFNSKTLYVIEILSLHLLKKFCLILIIHKKKYLFRFFRFDKLLDQSLYLI